MYTDNTRLQDHTVAPAEPGAWTGSKDRAWGSEPATIPLNNVRTQLLLLLTIIHTAISKSMLTEGRRGAFARMSASSQELVWCTFLGKASLLRVISPVSLRARLFLRQAIHVLSDKRSSIVSQASQFSLPLKLILS